MSRIEKISRALVMGGIVFGIATVGVIVGNRLFGGPKAPDTTSLGPLLEHATVLHDRERDNFGTNESNARSVLLAVPEAANQELARTGLLRHLRNSGWAVSSGGGAVGPDENVCLVVSTPTSWLADGQNRELREDFESRVNGSESTTVIVDEFFC